MTRFARAKGSKSSNERLPNEATPWHVMKQQLEENRSKEPLEKRKSAKELLQDKKDVLDNNIKGNNHDWAEFDDDRPKINMKKHKKIKLNKNDGNSTENPKEFISIENKSIGKLKETENVKVERTDNGIVFKKKQIDDLNLPSNEGELSVPKDNKCSDSAVLSKRQKRNLKRKLETCNESNKKFKQDILSRSNKVKGKEIKKTGKFKRRKPDQGVTKIIINGVEIEIVMFDRFPIRKEDAERLTELRQKLIMKGIPKSEVDMAMKLERRKAEKALARVKKLVCFNCRKSGHNLSDCPELDPEEARSGICFKCGSTEHTHFECKVNKDSAYRYAKCFICHEQGHIAAQCPDNPKGIYPHGGCCKICSAVTHLKKDCPDLVKAKEDNVITVEKMDNSVVEYLQEDVKEKCENNKTKNKIIKF